MRRILPALALVGLGVGAGPAFGHGLLIPADKSIPPLAMLDHHVTIAIEDQVAVTRVEQSFRNHTDRALEATYLFPVPAGASVRKFALWVDGKETAGELVEADRARQIYTDIVRRTQDPALLEYMGSRLFRLRIFPVPPKGDQKVALSYTAVAPRDAGLVEYTYPMRTDGKATRTLEKFSLQATIKSQHPLQSIYSPTHAITVSRPNDREAVVRFERDQALLDKDFLLYYSVSDQDVGLTLVPQRPVPGEPGYFLLLLTPRVEFSKGQTVPRDLVLVLDTSGSMRGPKMHQAKKALRYCLAHLGSQDRFALINFATTVNRYKDALVETGKEQVEQANKWVDDLEATGGTAIDDALQAALQFRKDDPGRVFTIVFFTDGCPTVGETRPEQILKNFAARNTANTRVFTFGVGDDVNATMLDTLADQTRAVSTYVRPAEDIEAKVSSLHGKISHPVLTDLKLTVGPDVRLTETYPPQLPDLFQGGQVVVLGRYSGKGPAAIRLTGQLGKEPREFVYEVTFPEKTAEDRGFVEHLWARRKVGYLLDQIRANGAQKELVEETVRLAKKYGIATPYTSYLVVPDGPVPVVRGGRNADHYFLYAPGGRPGGGGLAPRSAAGMPGGAAPAFGGFGAGGAGKPATVADYARQLQAAPGDLGTKRDRLEESRLKASAGEVKARNGAAGASADGKVLRETLERKQAYDQARGLFLRRDKDGVQSGKLGVDLSLETGRLRNQSRLEATAQRTVAGRTCIELGGVWIDEGFEAKTAVVTVKAMSDAYFRILERHPEVKPVFQLGNHLVWVAPSGTALVIDTQDGKDKLTDAEIDRLFAAKK